MSIEITGPKGYDYQYLATAYLALSLYAQGITVAAFYIEKVDGEDAEISYLDGAGVTQTIEVQVKSDAGKFGLEFLGGILCHFGNQQATHNLASRLLADKNRKAFIIVQGRCDDDTAHFLVENGKFHKDAINLPVDVAKGLVQVTGDFEKDGTSKLKIKRHKFCETLANDLEQGGLLDSLVQQVFVYEKLLQGELRDRCEQLLFKGLNIPLLQAGTVLDGLLKSIIEGRNHRHDIGAEFHKLIDANQARRPDVKSDYLKRPEEQVLIDQLRLSHRLLLKGRSLCGKSSTAKAVARYFTDQGYLYLITSNYEDAERFLLSADIVDKVCVLDDPMGFMFQEVKSAETLQRVRHLVDALPAGRKVIVTVNNDVLTRLNADQDTAWVDLTIRDPEIAAGVWLQWRAALPDEIFCRVDDFIKNSDADKILQPGQLYFIANNSQGLGINTDLWKFAAVDADRVADTVRQKGETAMRVFRAMSMVCNTIAAVKVFHLDYLFSTTDEFPAIRSSRFGLPGHWLTDIEDEGTDYFPVYPMLLNSAFNWQPALDFLVRCGFLYYNRGAYNFPHPVYYQAAQQLLTGLQKGEADEVEADLKKGICLLAFENALIASRQLGYIYSSNNEEVKQKMISLAMIMERSIFPAMIDNSLVFLTRATEYLNEEQLDKAQSRLTSFEMDAGAFRWHDGIPFIPDAESVGRRLDLEYGIISKEGFDTFHSRMLSSDQPNLTPEEAWNFSKYLKYRSIKSPLTVEPLILNKLLDYNEGFIRSIAAYHIFYQFCDPPLDLVNKALYDAHPFVVLNAIKGFVRGWYKYDGPVREPLLNLILLTLGSPDIVTAATNFITQFGIGYSRNSFDWREDIPEENKPEMWQLWAKFTVKFFAQIPGNIRFHTHRFIATVQDAHEKLPAVDQAIICKAWLKWLRSSEKYSSYDDSLFYVCNFYFGFRESLTLSEQAVFAGLLIDRNFPYFTANNIRLFLHHWDELTAEEKGPVLTFAGSGEDLIFKAIMLTTSKCPKELNQLILGMPQWEDMPVSGIVALIPRPLMEACISARFITHRFSGLNYASGKLWYQILGYFLNQPSDILCKVAVKMLLDAYFSGSEGDYTGDWGNTETILVSLFQYADVLSFIYYALLEETAESSGSNSSPLWSLLKVHTDADFHEFMKRGIVDNIKDIETADNLDIIETLWGNKFFEKEFPIDAGFSLMLHDYYQIAEPGQLLMETMADSFEKILTDVKPKLCLTFDHLIAFAKKLDSPRPGLLKIAKEGREDFFKEDFYERRQKLRELVDAPLGEIYIN